MKYIPIAGTGAREHSRSWHQADSDTAVFLDQRGFDRLGDDLPFWSSALSGTRFCGNNHSVWQYGGAVLRRWLLGVPLDDRNLIAHSHGGQIVAYALAGGVQVRSVVTVASPIRRDMDEVWESCGLTGESHLHLYGVGWGDRWRWFGQRGRFKRAMAGATNFKIEGGHSGMLTRPDDYADQWSRVLSWIRSKPHYE